MLRLLAQREQGYEDIAALMGLSIDEVRAKVKDALAEIDESRAPVAEATEAPAVEPEKPTEPEKAQEPPPSPPAKEPAAEKAPADPPESVTPPPPPAKPSSSPRSRIRLPKDQRLLAGGAAGVVAIALILILILVIGGGGGSSSSSTTTTTTTPTPSANTTASGQNLTQAVLSPVNGGSASGKALFGRIKSSPVLQVEAQGLHPSPSGQSYTVWLYRSPKLVLRVGAVKVGKSGGIAAQFPIPTQVLAYVAGGAFDQIDLSLTPDAAYEAEVARAKKEKRLPAYTGEDILRGKITGPAVKK
ncbi:MAG TPA: hypothetical protein VNY83_09250 [Solirubrobacterales bacterium]|jgi:hypothetical protein|nr:hypothetical protein [Solirubrobacterales bacterium]